MALRHWLQLSMTDGLGPILTRRLIDTLGSAEAACTAGIVALRQVEGIGQAKAEKIQRSLRQSAGEIDAELARATESGATLICPDDGIYPVLLRSIPDPPAVLYVKGTLEPRDLHSLAIVGSRRCSYYGREQAERFAALLAGAGMTVTSGGARGIDSAAHRGAMSHPQGRTIAVLGCGIDVVYPPENTALFEQIESRGAILSEYPMGTPPLQENFPRRNRIVSGISRGVLVVEADERSGALITARQACDDHGRTVFALPGRVDNVMSAGPHLLIRDGATLVRNLEDILDGLDPLPQEALEISRDAGVAAPIESDEIPDLTIEPRAPMGSMTDRQESILSHMDGQPMSVDRLIDLTSLDASIILQELTFLSLKGMVRRVDGQSFMKRSH